MAKKYLRNTNGIVRAVTSDNLQLEKPLLNENYDIEVHNRNMDKIDSAIQEVKGKVDGLELTAERVSIADSTNKFEATNVEDALLENKTSILNNTNLANQALNKANEAFQRGDNVKTQLVDKLISEGLEVSTNNTFEELIGNIALGKKWASGSTTTTITNSTSSATTICSALPFKPSLAFVMLKTQHGVYSPCSNVVFTNLVQSIISNASNGQCIINSDNSLSLQRYDRNGISGSISIDWYAFE